MRVLTCILALCALAWAQEPSRTTEPISAITPKTWAQNATSTRQIVPAYSAPPISWTTITSGSVIYKVAVTPTVVGYSTITTGGGVMVIPITSAAVPTIIGNSEEPFVPSNTHRTRTIVLSVIFSFIGAILLILAAMFLMRVRAQRRMRNNRSWAIRPGGWIDESKQSYPMDLEINTNRNSNPFSEPQVPHPVPSHTRQRSL
ncbi:hypothetical protein RSOLAG1IB_04450 [Rhizoctonia solani AG-1 IB]|uniref:Mid2 domain-containing protein n=1 Tax=Thanatephorus cucumeris (strain AG1-IB / isolate 7/3/14) TaxID=1108050 RepID=A0A0B7FVI4_THACB|nr:hypothetical protein RSOLAG1IB_04450 [Rhizoctonia solani AG-1 IB]